MKYFILFIIIRTRKLYIINKVIYIFYVYIKYVIRYKLFTYSIVEEGFNKIIKYKTKLKEIYLIPENC